MGAIRMLGTTLDMSSMESAVQQAQATADNARQMVLNRDPRLTAVEQEATTLAQRQAAFAWTATTALALLATKDYTLTLNRPMANSTYEAKVVVDPGLAGKLNAEVISKTASTVTVRTTALIAVGVGGFTVIAWL